MFVYLFILFLINTFNMKKHIATLVVSNNSDNTLIQSITMEFEGSTMKQAVGFALKGANEILNSQYDKPQVTINGIQLSPADSKKCKASFWDFTLNFPSLRELIMASLVDFSDEKSRLEYVKSTDRNHLYDSAKSVTIEQAAAQAKEVIKLTRDLTRWAKADAKASVVPPEVEERRLFLAEQNRQKRLAEGKTKTAKFVPANTAAEKNLRTTNSRAEIK
jgi:secreted Zn-dependent insulinase-like peptidase